VLAGNFPIASEIFLPSVPENAEDAQNFEARLSAESGQKQSPRRKPWVRKSNRRNYCELPTFAALAGNTGPFAKKL
jgi:hypothetical protein